VLLLGPLYHLPDRADRVRALAEARRAVRPGGLVVAATINRLAPVHDMSRVDRFTRPAIRAAATEAAATGVLNPVDGMGFTTAYLHHPTEVPGEFTDAGLTGVTRYSVEGALWLLADLEARLTDPERRAPLLDAIRLGESDPSMLGACGHLLTAGRRPA
jgi:SAM-dependent methyltransferase